MTNPAYFGPVLYKLHLGTFPTINKEVMIFQIEQLAGLMPAISRSR